MGESGHLTGCGSAESHPTCTIKSVSVASRVHFCIILRNKKLWTKNNIKCLLFEDGFALFSQFFPSEITKTLNN